MNLFVKILLFFLIELIIIVNLFDAISSISLNTFLPIYLIILLVASVVIWGMVEVINIIYITFTEFLKTRVAGKTVLEYSLNDYSLWFLLFSNLVTIFFAIKESWSIETILWIYWIQSIVIGLFNFIRIIQLNDFSTKGFTINGHAVLSAPQGKIYTAFFFLLHYGIFHIFYYMTLLADDLDRTEVVAVLLTSLLFFANHLFSFIYNKSEDNKQQNIGTLMFYPYARIIPMHLIAMYGPILALGGNSIVIVFFLMLKTLADATMHIVEHLFLRRRRD